MPTLTFTDGTSAALTVDELLEYQAKKAASAAREPRSAPAAAPRPAPAPAPAAAPVVEVAPAPDERWATFCGFLAGRTQAPQRKLLALIKGKAGGSMTYTEIMRAMGLSDASKASGTFSGIRKNTKKAGFRPDDIITRDSSGGLKAGPILLQKEPPNP